MGITYTHGLFVTSSNGNNSGCLILLRVLLISYIIVKLTSSVCKRSTFMVTYGEKFIFVHFLILMLFDD